MDESALHEGEHIPMHYPAAPFYVDPDRGT